MNIEFFTKEACEGKKDAVTEIPCVAYNPNDNNKTDLSPLIKVSGLSATVLFVANFRCGTKVEGAWSLVPNGVFMASGFWHEITPDEDIKLEF